MAKFDESKIITVLHPEKAEIGKKYWFSDDLLRLKHYVESGDNDERRLGVLYRVETEDDLLDFPFYIKGDGDWRCLYPYEEEPKYRPYKDTEEMINDFCERFGVKRTNFGEPFIWIMHKTCKRLIISYDVNSVYVQYCSEIENITMQELLDNFTYLDGSICGVINC